MCVSIAASNQSASCMTYLTISRAICRLSLVRAGETGEPYWTDLLRKLADTRATKLLHHPPSVAINVTHPFLLLWFQARNWTLCLLQKPSRRLIPVQSAASGIRMEEQEIPS